MGTVIPDLFQRNLFIESLRGLSGKLTILMTTHRIPTIALATHVMVLNRGTVIQHGPIADLLGEENGPLSHIVARHDKAV
jgi:ABC-type multidrug transport system ATPase subunit